MEYVTLVDEYDTEIGTAEKMEAHRVAQLHRACSVVLFNDRGELLLQQRNPAKYHSGGLWSNTCCTHPRPNESPAAAASRRLQEEMGLEADLEHAFSFIYRADLDHDLTEYEYDHVFVGRSNAEPVPNAEEVSDWRWADPDDVARDMVDRPERYTRWFVPLFDRLMKETPAG